MSGWQTVYKGEAQVGRQRWLFQEVQFTIKISSFNGIPTTRKTLHQPTNSLTLRNTEKDTWTFYLNKLLRMFMDRWAVASLQDQLSFLSDIKYY